MPKLTCKRAKEIYEKLKTCSAEEFLNSWRIWFDEIFSVFVDEEHFSPDSTVSASKKASSLILNEFLHVTIQFPTVSKEFGSEKIQILIPKLISSSSNFDDNILLALRSCLKYFPSSCGRLTAKFILPYLCKFFDCNLHSVRRLAAECFSYLPIVGPGGEKRSKHAENWTKQMNFLLFTAHKCFHSLTDVERNARETDLCQFSLKSDQECCPELVELSSLDVEKLINRTKFCFASIKFMLSRSTEFQIQISLMEWIRFLRCMTHVVTSQNDKIQLNDACRSFLDAFNVLPSIVRYSLAPYCAEIFDLFETILHKTTKSSSEFRRVKLEIYNGFEEISTVLGAASKLQLYFSKIWRYCKTDFQTSTSSTDTILKIENVSRFDNRKHKKFSKKMKESIDVVDQFVQKCPDMRLDRTCIVSCGKMLSSVIRRVGPALKPSTFRDLQQFFCKLIMNFQITRCTKAPYDDGQCRLIVYTLLKSLIFCQHPNCPPAIQCALSIFDEGSRDADEKIAEFCTASMQTFNNITKPRVPCLETTLLSSEPLKPIEIDETGDDENFVTDRTNDSEKLISSYLTANGTGNGLPAHLVDEQAVEDDSDEERIVVNIDSESSDECDSNGEDIQIVSSPAKKPKMDASIKSYAQTKLIDDVKIVDIPSEDVSHMLSDFVDEEDDS